jgi:predicted transcriptional regulator
MTSPSACLRLCCVKGRLDIQIDPGLECGVATADPSGYTPGMKTAISIPDDVFQEADRLAAELKQSRSQLYSRAVREYVARHSSDKVTAALDAVYAGEEDEPEREFLRIAARRTLEHSEW